MTTTLAPAWSITAEPLGLAVVGRALDDDLRAELHARVPGSRVGVASTEVPALSIAADASVPDVRRLLNSLLARAATKRGALLVHGAAAGRNGAAVLLVGGHQSGKTVTSLELASRGATMLAGDTAVVSAAGDLVSGSRVVLARSSTATGPRTTLPLPRGEERVEAAWCDGGPYEGWRIAAVALVDVSARRAHSESLDLDASDLASALTAAAQYPFSRSFDDGRLAIDIALDAATLDHVSGLAAAIAGSTRGVDLRHLAPAEAALRLDEILDRAG